MDGMGWDMGWDGKKIKNSGKLSVLLNGIVMFNYAWTRTR
jgi:hypothetical protein